MVWKILGIWAAVISVISLILTVYDKIAAKKRPKHRVRESTLLLFSALGGSLVMFITMLVIRHKTQHIKFMLGIPVIMVFQLVAVYLLYRFLPL